MQVLDCWLLMPAEQLCAVAKSVKRSTKLVVLLQVLMLIFFRLLNFHCAFSMFIFYSGQGYISYHRCLSGPAVLSFWDQHASITFRYSYAYCVISDFLRLAFTLNLSFLGVCRCLCLHGCPYILLSVIAVVPMPTVSLAQAASNR